jgi:enoyl-CoA hydratase/carnithine racemase
LSGAAEALEILLAADDLDGPRAEQYGYVNRCVADDRLDDVVDQIASRLARFDHDAIARTKSYVDHVRLPTDSELMPALADFCELLGRPGQQARLPGSKRSASTQTATSNAISVGASWSPALTLELRSGRVRTRSW